MIVFDIASGNLKIINPETPDSSDGFIDMGTRDADLSIDTGDRSSTTSVIDFESRV